MPTTWKRADRVLWRIVLDDAVILVPGRSGASEPFALAGGAALWDLLAEPRSALGLMRLIAGSGASPHFGEEAELAVLLAALADAGAVEQIPE